MKKRKIQIEIALGAAAVMALAFSGYYYWKAGKNTSLENLIKVNVPTLDNQTAVRENEMILFATNGIREIYIVKRDDKWVVVEDGKESQAYDYVATPAFSMDGNQFAYSAGVDGTVYVVVNDVAQATDYVAILEMLFSNDGLKMAYVADTGSGYVVVVNEQAGKTYEQLATMETENGTGYLIFSSDSEKLAYKVQEGDQVFIVVNGEEGQKFTEITDFVFSSDGSQYAYQAETTSQEQVTVVNQDAVNNASQNNAGSGSGSDSSNNNSSGSGTTSNTNGSGSGTGSSSRSGSRSTTTTIIPRTGGVDVYVDPNSLNYEVCTGNDCNF